MTLDIYFPYRLAITAEQFSRTISEVYRNEFGLSREEWRLLFLLSNGETMDSQTLLHRTSLDKVQISRASQRLEDKDLITRSISKSDRRLRDFRLTPAGSKLFQTIKPKVDARASAILNAMSETDRQALDTGLQALYKSMQSQTDEQGS